MSSGLIFLVEPKLWILMSLCDMAWIDQGDDLFHVSFCRYQGNITPDSFCLIFLSVWLLYLRDAFDRRCDAQ